MRRFSVGVCTALSLLFATSDLHAQGQFRKNQHYIAKFDIVPSGDTNKIVVSGDDSGKTYSMGKGSKIFIESATPSTVMFKVTKVKQPKNADALNVVEKDVLYVLDPSKSLGDILFRRLAGFAAGIATTPFKYRPDQGRIYPGGNLAASGAYSYSLGWLTLTPTLFAGLTAVALADVNAQSTETKAGFTFGPGLSFNVYDIFVLSIVLGWDYVEKTWESNGRAWYGLSFGVPILN